MSKIVVRFNASDDLIIAASCTPFLQNGDLNLDGFEKYADQMVKSGVTGLFVNGTLGEGMSMTVEERIKALEKWMSLKLNRFQSVIVHAGSNSIRESIALVEHAEKVGVDAVAVMCPTVFKPSSISNLVNYLKAIAERAPNTPFLYYDINVLTGVVFDTAEVMRQCKASIPTFSGIKYSCRELGNYEAAMMETENGRYKMMLGTVDEVFLPWLTIGARIPICHSFMGQFHAASRRAYLSGDMEKARENQQLSQKLGLLKRKYGADVAVSKTMLRILGIDVGPVRLPLEELSEQSQKSLENEMRQLNVL